MYWYTSKEVTGTAALAFAVGLALLTGFYVLFTGRRLPKRPEDRQPLARSSRAPARSGSSARTGWSAARMGLAAATASVGFAVGWWLFLDRVPVHHDRRDRLRLQKYYRGNFSH